MTRPATISAPISRDFGVELIATPSPHGSSRAVSTRSAGGEPTYEFNAAAKARRIRFGEAERAAIAAAPIVAVSCFPFDDVAQTLEFTEAVRAAGVRLAIDPNPRSGMMTDRAEFVSGFEALAGGASFVKVGEDDAHLLYGGELDALRARLIDMGVGAVLATEGAAGATIEAGTDVVTRPISSLQGRIVDTMGAGDAAFATAVAGLLRDHSRGRRRLGRPAGTGDGRRSGHLPVRGSAAAPAVRGGRRRSRPDRHLTRPSPPGPARPRAPVL